jgi:hypothetical protein
LAFNINTLNDLNLSELYIKKWLFLKK